MKESAFRFKGFEITQNEYVHKVGTDGVLLGAWARAELSDECILDIGTGTGLIALMLAQRTPSACIHAIELDSNACSLTQKNFSASPFSKRIQLHHCALQEFTINLTFDHIVVNPPFFNNRLKSPVEIRSIQRHNDALSFDDLAETTFRFLNQTGRLSIIIPSEEGELMTSTMKQKGFKISRLSEVSSKPNHSAIRQLMEFSKVEKVFDRSALTLLDENGYRTPEYQKLTSDFYL